MQYDAAIIGGGLAGSAVGRGLAQAGARVLIVERQRRFKDRVRGETAYPWGASEAGRLGIENLLLSTCACSVGRWQGWMNGTPWIRRNLVKSTSAQRGCLNFFHPEMQEILLSAAEDAGAEVRRGANVTEVNRGRAPSVRFRAERSENRAQARLIIGADGRGARTRKWASFRVRRETAIFSITGVLAEGVRVAEDCMQLVQKFPAGQVAVLPLGAGRFRMYCMLCHGGGLEALKPESSFENFRRACERVGAPSEWLQGTRAAGRLARFECTEEWVPHPFRENVALIGDAAATNDPSWGCGLALSLRDARVLLDSLLSHPDWMAGAEAYASQHDAYYGAMRTLQLWMAELFYGLGARAEQRRIKAMPVLTAEPGRIPDLVGCGPEWPQDDGVKRRFFAGESA
jgi:menaquinone-9 beta-reductase